MIYNNNMYKTKSVKLNKKDLIFDEKDYEDLYYKHSHSIKSYVPKSVKDELEASKAKIVELTEEIEELKREIETLKAMNEC